MKSRFDGRMYRRCYTTYIPDGQTGVTWVCPCPVCLKCHLSGIEHLWGALWLLAPYRQFHSLFLSYKWGSSPAMGMATVQAGLSRNELMPAGQHRLFLLMPQQQQCYIGCGKGSVLCILESYPAIYSHTGSPPKICTYTQTSLLTKISALNSLFSYTVTQAGPSVSQKDILSCTTGKQDNCSVAPLSRPALLLSGLQRTCWCLNQSPEQKDSRACKRRDALIQRERPAWSICTSKSR